MVYFNCLVFAKTNIVGTRYKAVLTCTYNLCFGLKEEKYLLFSSDNCLFTAVKIALSSWWNDIVTHFERKMFDNH